MTQLEEILDSLQLSNATRLDVFSFGRKTPHSQLQLERGLRQSLERVQRSSRPAPVVMPLENQARVLPVDLPDFAIPSIAEVVAQVEKQVGLDIHVRSMDLSESAIHAMLVVYPDEALITYDSRLSHEWARLSVAKELAHLVTNHERAVEVFDVSDFRRIIDEASRPNPSDKGRIGAKHHADLLRAIDLLLPEKGRRLIAEELQSNRVNARDIAALVTLPVDAVKLLYHSKADLSPEKKSVIKAMLRRTLRNRVIPATPSHKAVNYGEAALNLLEQGGGATSVAEFARMTGRPPTAILEDIKRRRLFGIMEGRHWRLPKDQVEALTSEPDALAEVLKTFKADVNPMIVLQFLVTPDSSLGGVSPLIALKAGKANLSRVKRVASAHQGDGFA